MINYYSLLKISPDISQKELEISFSEFKKELASFSPGVTLSDEELAQRNPESWKAYQLLLDTNSRKEYDYKLERELAHISYETKNNIDKIVEPPSSKRKVYLYGTVVVGMVVLIFLALKNNSIRSLKDHPSWKQYFVTDEVRILLPGQVDSTNNILPPYLMGFLKRTTCVVSCLSNGFSVTAANLELNDNYIISFRDLNYVGSMEMQNPHAMFIRDPNETYMNVKGYKLLITKGKFQLDDVVRAYDNYTFINKSKAIKVIVNYVPGNLLHEKYAEIIFKSLLQK